MDSRTRTTLKIIQHNVLKFTAARSAELNNKYMESDPDVIMLNATGLPDEPRVKIYGYDVYQKNNSGEDHAGVAIAVRRGLLHRLEDDYEVDTLAITIETNHGPVTLVTTYIPPRRAYINHNDFNKFLQLRRPVYLLADLNANHNQLGYNNSNIVGRSLIRDFVSRNKLNILGPDFPTMVTGRGRPELVASNSHAHLDYRITQGDVTT